MKKVYSSDDFLVVGSLRQVLENNHIECFTRNEYLIGGSGELPPTECWPELWVERAIDYQRAERLVRETLEAGASSGGTWICPGCGEALQPQFTACWNCGTPHPEGNL